MFGSQILDVAIGLIFIYLLLSLVVTALQEVLAAWFRWRAENLWVGICNLLGPQGANLAQKIYDHPIVNGLSQPGKKPTYIPSRTFALALLESIAPSQPDKISDLAAITGAMKQLPEEVQKTLTALLQDSGQNLDDFKKRIEIWFNDGMDRVIGWYKRRTQTILLVMGFGVAAGLNADTVAIARKLYSSPEKRAAILEKVKAFQTTSSADALRPPGGAEDAPRTASNESEALSRELNDAATNVARSVHDVQMTSLTGWTGEAWPSSLRGYASKAAGLALTALAISLGAPFWFDLLNKFMNVRAAGRAPEEESKTPKKVPPPRAEGGGSGG